MKRAGAVVPSVSPNVGIITNTLRSVVTSGWVKQQRGEEERRREGEKERRREGEKEREGDE
jgi:hypothetical protein